MVEPLEAKIFETRRRGTRLAGLRAGLRLISTGLVAFWVLAGVDWFFRPDDLTWRAFLSLVWLAMVFRCVWRDLVPLWTVREDDVELARRIQRRFPELGDGLASSVEFLQRTEEDPRFGSAALRRQAIRETNRRVERLDFSVIFDPRPTIRAGWTAFLLGLITLGLVLVVPETGRTAAGRLFAPWGQATWPRRTHLEVRHATTRLTPGSPFEVDVVERFGRPLPEDTRIVYRLRDVGGRREERSEAMVRQGKRMIARRESVRRPFAFRIEGGDDRSMRWITVEVVPPPVIESCRVHVEPPLNTGLVPSTTEGEVKLAAGSWVSFLATVDRPVQKAVLVWQQDQKVVGRVFDEGRKIEVGRFSQAERADPTGADSTATEPLVIERSGDYRFVLTDPKGLTTESQPLGRIDVVEDRSPKIELRRPNTEVVRVPDGRVTIEAEVVDDLAVRQVELIVKKRVPPSEEPTRTMLYQGPDTPPTRTDLAHPDRSEIKTDWDGDRTGWAPGEEFDFWLVASDYRGHTTKSSTRRLSVVDRPRLVSLLRRRWQFLLNEAARAESLQKASREKLVAFCRRLEETGRFNRDDQKLFLAAALDQHQVDRLLALTGDGLGVRLNRFCDEMAENRLERTDWFKQTVALKDLIGRLNREVLPTIGQRMEQMGRRLEEGADSIDRPDQAVDEVSRQAKRLSQVVQMQSEVMVSLQRVLGEVEGWNRLDGIRAQWAGILAEQTALLARSGSMASQTLGRPLEELSLPQREELNALAAAESMLAGRFDQLSAALDEQVSGPSAESNRAALAQTGHHVETTRIGPRIHSAAEALYQNRIGAAVTLERSICADLEIGFRLLHGERSVHAKEKGDQTHGPIDPTAVRKWIDRQKTLMERTAELDGKQDQWGRGERIALRRIAEAQDQLAEATEQVRKETESPVFALVLKRSAAAMREAGNRLRRELVDYQTQTRQQEALDDLRVLVEVASLQKNGQAETEADLTQRAEGRDVAAKKVESRAWTRLELELIRRLQTKVNRQTQAWREKWESIDPLPEEARVELTRLAQEQEKLAELLFKLTHVLP